MLDLYNNKYDRQTLKDNIYAVKLIDVLKTQHIDVTFAVRYLLNDKYYLDDNDEKITSTMVLFYQPHISKKDLLNGILKYESDDDSIDYFVIISNKKK